MKLKSVTFEHGQARLSAERVERLDGVGTCVKLDASFCNVFAEDEEVYQLAMSLLGLVDGYVQWRKEFGDEK